MIKTLVLDVDGVINGALESLNTPFPSKPVIKALQKFKNAGGFIVFCTSKGVYPIVEMVRKFEFAGIHITDAGGIIYDANLDNYIVDSLPEPSAKKIINLLESTGNYFEVYTSKEWYILEKFNNKYIDLHANLLRRQPIRLNNFDQFQEFNLISKFLYFSEEETSSKNNLNLVESLSAFDTKWTVSPVLQPANLLVVTKKGISKQSALQKIAQNHGIDLNHALGVGDHHSDWKFMNLCGYKGIMGNSTEELIDLAKQEDQSTVAFGKSVDEDGVIDILQKFNAI